VTEQAEGAPVTDVVAHRVGVPDRAPGRDPRRTVEGVVTTAGRHDR
jgi:hypothetical protein